MGHRGENEFSGCDSRLRERTDWLWTIYPTHPALFLYERILSLYEKLKKNILKFQVKSKRLYAAVFANQEAWPKNAPTESFWTNIQLQAKEEELFLQVLARSVKDDLHLFNKQVYGFLLHLENHPLGSHARCSTLCFEWCWVAGSTIVRAST